MTTGRQEVNIRALLKRLNMSQTAFAIKYGFDLSALRDWIQQRRRPDTTAWILLRVIERDPEVVNRVLQAAGKTTILSDEQVIKEIFK